MTIYMKIHMRGEKSFENPKRYIKNLGIKTVTWSKLDIGNTKIFRTTLQNL